MTNMLERIKTECSKQQIMNESLDENTPLKSDLRYYMPFIASSFVNESSIEIAGALECLFEEKGWNKPNAEARAVELCAKYKLLQEINRINDARTAVLLCMEDSEPELPTKLVCVYNGNLYEYRSPNQKNVATFVYREAYDIRANYEKVLEALKNLKQEIHEYLEGR